jgi:protein TonB
MFEHVVLETRGRGRRATSAAIAVTGQVIATGMALLIPLVWIERLPLARLEAPVLGPPPPAAVKIVGTVLSRVSARTNAPAALYVPRRIPQTIPAVADFGEAPSLAPEFSGDGGVPGGTGSIASLGLIGDLIRLPAPKPAAAVTEETVSAPKPTVERIKVGGAVQAAKIRKQVLPIYPPLAHKARISGTVVLEGIINREGQIEQLRALSGHPLLVQAALDAVRQWLYEPTRLNGNSVEVLAPIEVHFRLSN